MASPAVTINLLRDPFEADENGAGLGPLSHESATLHLYREILGGHPALTRFLSELLVAPEEVRGLHLAVRSRNPRR